MRPAMSLSATVATSVPSTSCGSSSLTSGSRAQPPSVVIARPAVARNGAEYSARPISSATMPSSTAEAPDPPNASLTEPLAGPGPQPGPGHRNHGRRRAHGVRRDVLVPPGEFRGLQPAARLEPRGDGLVHAQQRARSVRGRRDPEHTGLHTGLDDLDEHGLDLVPPGAV